MRHILLHQIYASTKNGMLPSGKHGRWLSSKHVAFMKEVVVWFQSWAWVLRHKKLAPNLHCICFAVNTTSLSHAFACVHTVLAVPLLNSGFLLLQKSVQKTIGSHPLLSIVGACCTRCAHCCTHCQQQGCHCTCAAFF